MHGRKKIVVLILISAWLLTACEQEDEMQEIVMENLEEEGVSSEESSIPETIFVDVCGRVRKPGVYELPAGSRVYEALDAAGGILENAATESINQAVILEDGQQIYVLSEEELREQQQTGTGSVSGGKLDINKASKEELMTLPGIGEAKAEAIIRYREQEGRFQSIEEIMEIEGIKEGVFHKIEDWITAL